MSTKFFTNEGQNTLLNKFNWIFENNMKIPVYIEPIFRLKITMENDG